MISYDLHIHTCLSADADDGMTPDKVVDRAVENGLDIIAITDHNSFKNVQAAWDWAEDNYEGKITIVPGVEIESSEEVHMTCLFPDLSSMYRMEKLLVMNLTDKKNNPDKLGHQYIYDIDLGKREEKMMLKYPASMTIEEIIFAAKQMNGIAMYSHLDSRSYSVMSALGMIPEFPRVKAFEFTNSKSGRSFAEDLRDRHDQLFLYSSNAHRLDDINTKENSDDLDRYADDIRNYKGMITARSFVEWLRTFEGI